MSNQWGAHEPPKPKSFPSGMATLAAVTNPLPENVKKAFLAAAHRFGVIKQATWDGCAFNAASIASVEKFSADDEWGGVAGTKACAEFFHCDEQMVARFIEVWDMHGSDNATRDLVSILTGDYDRAQATAIVAEAKKGAKITTIVVFESTLKDFSEDLSAGKFSDAELEEFFPAEVRELLGV